MFIPKNPYWWDPMFPSNSLIITAFVVYLAYWEKMHRPEDPSLLGTCILPFSCYYFLNAKLLIMHMPVIKKKKKVEVFKKKKLQLFI